MKKRVARAVSLSQTFVLPILVLFSIFLFLLFSALHMRQIAIGIAIIGVGVGTYQMFKKTVESLFAGHFALDYIAIIAIIVSLLIQEYLVATILALMIATGRTLEEYGVSQAKSSLTQLIDRIPSNITLWHDGRASHKKNIKEIVIGDIILIRKGEVIPLDGELVSEAGETDESSLTGEPYFIEKAKGDIIRSGTINIGQPMVIQVTKTEENSTYKKIITMVQLAEDEKSPMVRLADQYSTIFTLITFVIAGFAYYTSHYDLTRVLSVLAVATPCPLIIATPIALLGGMNVSAKKKIIIKKLAALEALSRITAIVFDKTGTITLGKPVVTSVTLTNKTGDIKTLLGIAEAIERNSLHPLAKAIVSYAKEQNAPVLHATHITETIGQGIRGTIDAKEYQLIKQDKQDGMSVALYEKQTIQAIFLFTDEIKQESKATVSALLQQGLQLHIFTGDTKVAAEKIEKQLGQSVHIKADCTPEEKQNGISELKKNGEITAMVGDGINDAPALALADVGMAFSNQEQTAASEAADIIFLGGDFSMVLDSWQIAKRTITIARESILWGIGLSLLAMVCASFGLLPPIYGAGLQEAIDVAVILNALRASR